MFFRKIAIAFIGVLGFAGGFAHAQSEARIRIVIPSIKEQEDDLQWMIGLSPNPQLKAQWTKLKDDILDAFTEGVDLTQPASMDLVFRKDEFAREMRIPISVFDVKKDPCFLNNIKGMGFKVQPMPGGLYQISDRDKKAIFLRYDAKTKYVWTSPLKASLPSNLPPAGKDLAPLLALKKDVVAQIKNNADGLKSRRDNFKELRKQFEALVKFRRNEEKYAYELRKQSLTQQLSEAERFLVESEELLASWTTTAVGPNPSSRGELALTALPGTDLEKSLEEFAAKPSYFANVTLHQNPLASGKITFPLDPMRKGHVKEFYKLVRPSLEAEIAKRPGKSDPEKTAMKQAMNIFLDILDAGAELGSIDAFIDLHPSAGEKNVMVCGIRAADGKVADGIFKLLPQIKPDWTTKPVEEHGGVSIHEVTIPKSRVASFQKVFADDTVCYVGTSKDAIWGAAGADAVAHLKAAIDEAAKPAPEKVDPVAINYQFQLSTLVTLMEILEKEVPAGNAELSKEEKQRLKDLERYRKLAQAAMAGCNSMIQGELKRVDKKMEGFIEMNECALKFVGSIIADAVKQIQ